MDTMQARDAWWTRANALTCLRLVAAPALVVTIHTDAAWAATAVFALAVASDVADGIVARRFDEQSGLGRLIDHARGLWQRRPSKSIERPFDRHRVCHP